MALPDLTGLNIQDTYKRLLQVSSDGGITDGTGSLYIPPTSSFAINVDSGSFLVTASVSGNEITLTKGDNSTITLIVDTGSSGGFTPSLSTDLPAQSITASANISASGQIFASIPSGKGFTDVITYNPSTGQFRYVPSSSIGGGGAFGDPPVINTTGFTLNEFQVANTVVGTVSVTDPTPGDTTTFAVQSGYTDGYFNINSNSGQITLASSSSRSWNTSAGSGSNLSHPFLIQVTDSQNNTTTGTIFIRVNPNQAPIWSETNEGTTISSLTIPLNENSTAGNNKARIYYRDPEGNSITIDSSSIDPAFSLTYSPSYIQLNQITSSLDYDTTSSYLFSLTASDSRYQQGVDNGAITTLPITISVTNNSAPTINPTQSAGSINENSSNGTNVGSPLNYNDNEGDTAIWSNFILKGAYKSGSSTNLTSSLTGTGLLDPTSNPFNINNGTGQVFRRNGVFLNDVIADFYEYQVSIRDLFDPIINSGSVTITVNPYEGSSIGVDGQTFYIVDTATTGDDIRTNSNGYSGGSAGLSSATTQRWEINTVPTGYVRFAENSSTVYTGSSVTFEVNNNIEGNLNPGQQISIQITASEDDFFTTKHFSTHTVDVTENVAWQVNFSNLASNLNTNGARPSNTLNTISFTELQSGIGDTLDFSSFTFTDTSGQLTASRSGDTYLVQALSNLSGSTSYSFSASIADNKGKIGSGSHSITIAQAPSGILTKNGSFYIIESATSSANIVISPNGRTGAQGDLGVTYTPEYNTPSVASFISTNPAISINSSGLLTLDVNLSGSSTGSGDIINTNITWLDQYGNEGGPTAISASVTVNNAPSATFTNFNYEAPQNAGIVLVSASITDLEGDTPYSMSIEGADASYLTAIAQNSDSSSYSIEAAINITTASSFNYTANVFDAFGKSTSYNRSINITATPPKWYAYLSEAGVFADNFTNAVASYQNASGIDNGSISPGYTFENFSQQNIGPGKISSSTSGVSFLVGQGTSLTSSNSSLLLNGLNQSTGSQGQTGLLVVFPSSSEIGTLPESMGNSLSDPTQGRYLLWADRVGSGELDDNPQTSFVRYYNMSGSNTYPNSSATRFGVIFTTGDGSNPINYYFMSTSGSKPSGEQ